VRFLCLNGVWKDGAGRILPTAPMQRSQTYSGDFQIPRIVAEEGYKEYAAQHGTSQSFERLCERGGFTPAELATLLFNRIKRLEEELGFWKNPGTKRHSE
jgi:hypothetical protein